MHGGVNRARRMGAQSPRSIEVPLGSRQCKSNSLNLDVCGSSLTLICHQDLTFLVRDRDLAAATSAAERSGLLQADERTLPRGYASDYCPMAKRFSLDDDVSRHGDYGGPRLILVPLSWTGISVRDTEPLTAFDLPFQMKLSRPLRIRTVPLHITCAAFVRIIAADPKHGPVTRRIVSDLTSVIGHNFFDMIYEGDYSEDEKVTQKDVEEMQAAVSAINSWEYPARDHWIKDAIFKAITGDISYRSFRPEK